ncbi:MAG: alpha-amylase family glycosyl hydrolase [Sumerlaeia bacterium]
MMRFQLCLAALCVAAIQTIAPAQVLDLTGTWTYREDPEEIGEEQGWQKPGADTADWGEAEVPGDIGDYDGVVWYRKTVDVPGDVASDPEARLFFGQVDDITELYLNGEKVYRHPFWNTPFFVEIGDHVPREGGELSIVAKVTDVGGPGGILGPVRIGPLEDWKSLLTTPAYELSPRSTLAEVGNLVMYSVYVRNFSEEGTFEGLRERLPELKGLGVNCLWLLPIHPIGEVERKGPDGSPYAIADYLDVNPDLGTKADFKAMVEDAHEHGMRVIIDCVFNHTAHDSVLTREHPEWFLQDEEGNPRPDVAAWQDVVDFAYGDPEVEAELYPYLWNVLDYWVREFDIDGYRCDVADLVPAEFWAEARQRLEAIKPGGIIMLAESQSSHHHLNGFDITYNEGLHELARMVMEGEAEPLSLKIDVLRRQYSMPKGAPELLFSENHDKQRAVNFYGGPEKAKLAGALVATLPGVPLLYTGTEVGADAERNETFFTVSPVDFSSDPHGMRAFWTSLLAMRAASPALQTGAFIPVEASPEGAIFAFERRTRHDRALVIANLSGETVTAELDHDLSPTKDVTLGAYRWTIFRN